MIFQNCSPSQSKTFSGVVTTENTTISDNSILDVIGRRNGNGDGYVKPSKFVSRSNECDDGIYGVVIREAGVYMQTVDKCAAITPRDVTADVQVNPQNPSAFVLYDKAYELDGSVLNKPAEIFCRGTGVPIGNSTVMGTVDVALKYIGSSESTRTHYYNGYVISNYTNPDTGLVDTEYLMINQATAPDADIEDRVYTLRNANLYRILDSINSPLEDLPSGGGVLVALNSPYTVRLSSSNTVAMRAHNYAVGFDFNLASMNCYVTEYAVTIPGGSSTGGSANDHATGGSSSGGTTSGGSTSGGSSSGGSTSGGSSSGGSTTGGSTTGGSTTGGTTTGGPVYTNWSVQTKNNLITGRGQWNSNISSAKPGANVYSTFTTFLINGAAQSVSSTRDFLGTVDASGTLYWGGTIPSCPTTATCIYRWRVEVSGYGSKTLEAKILPEAATTGTPSPGTTTGTATWNVTSTNNLANHRGLWTSRIYGAKPNMTAYISWTSYRINGVAQTIDSRRYVHGTTNSAGELVWGGYMNGCPATATCTYSYKLEVDTQGSKNLNVTTYPESYTGGGSTSGGGTSGGSTSGGATSGGSTGGTCTNWSVSSTNNLANGRGTWSSSIINGKPNASIYSRFSYFTINSVSQPVETSASYLGKVGGDGKYLWGGVINGCPAGKTCVLKWEMEISGCGKKTLSVTIKP